MTKNLLKKGIYRDFFPVDTYFKGRLRMQSFMIIGQRVPELSVRTNRHTEKHF